ncbi:MAG: cbb3-type cytochrome c oxidase subunit II [Desulfobacteraceae bacterium]|nr:cbb3-type cytochrome c oxidase subunit II [Desulfobacteraceae bacterium]MDH3573892.1 cbb3-type cytochrome c oxidase subunit II [Desulfobacteraceae bacterium]MDH3721100.1 cbb3-type cytochrome c oxidase subunit II [Desulfobacteraceae bacterium]MDH3836649.1 cbb3-type cytochrome c oxidase subunit II [Desulfobacteraceae bacterium]MDH3874451.1 cbb3-type cytochrome c oxidase subunit II [Desulfobacteraceae bacterium]
MSQKMTPKAVVIGSLLILAAVTFVVVLWPYANRDMTPSEIFRPRTAEEEEGRSVYLANGCVYCHSQSIRTIDWGHGAERIAQAGDYISDEPIALGSARTGVDLSQEGGEHPDDWHIAHFINPRYTRPNSIMPPFEWLGMKKIKALTAYIQSLGMKAADKRMERQQYWKKQVTKAYEAGPEHNVKWLAENVPEGWRNIPNPYPTTPAGLARGHKIYQDFCLGCHSPIGDGMGPAQPYTYPPPLNFTILKGREISGGIIYYQIMNGITGSAMPYFKRELESEKIWDVGNYVAVYFINQTDADTEPKGIDAAYEP